MKKLVIPLIILCFVLGFAAAPALAHTEADPFATDLIAGGGNPNSAMDVGDVLVWNDCDYLYVKYIITDPDWCITETHLQVATSLDGIPQKNGNPIPGKFEENDEHDCVADVLYTYNLAERGWIQDTQLYIAAHAVVQKDTGEICATEVIESYQGPMKNGQPVSDRGFANIYPENALYDPDSTYQHHETFFSLGYGGNIILGFPTFVGGSLTVYETTWGTFPAETAEVSVSQDGSTWTTLGTANNSEGMGGDDPHPTEFPLLTCVKYVKIVDTTDPALHADVSDAFDVDAVCAEYDCQEETAWGCCEDFPGKNWATFFTYKVQPCTIPPGGGFAYIGYEDWISGDFDYNDFGMNLRATEYYEYCESGGYFGLTKIVIEAEPVIYDSGMDHIIHIWRDLVGARKVTVEHTSPGSPGPINVPISGSGTNETPSGQYLGGSGPVDVKLFNTSKYHWPSKKCDPVYNFGDEMVTVTIEEIDPCLNPKTSPTGWSDRWDIDPVWQGYDPWEEGTLYNSFFSISNDSLVFPAPTTPWFREKAWQAAGHGHGGGGSCGADYTLDNVRVPMILVVPITDWVPPFEDTSITSPYAGFKTYYDAADGTTGAGWYEALDCTDVFPWNTSGSCSGPRIPGQYGCISCP